MSETVLTIEDAARCLSDVVERVQASGEAASLSVKSGRPLARIVPVPPLGQGAEDLIMFYAVGASSIPSRMSSLRKRSGTSRGPLNLRETPGNDPGFFHPVIRAAAI